VKGKDILIVEDENIVALDMRMRLESMGYRVLDVVDTGRLAIERASTLAPDLVLMDIKLKGDQDGIDAAAHLRERSEVPVIFVTAFTDERTLERAKRASPYGYVVKPFHERELRIAIELALYKHQYELSIRRARDIAEEANRVKGEFLANMSHELKTPLNSVIGFTELAMSASKEGEQREHLAIALSSAKSLLTLIDSILAFARMEAGKLNAVAVPFSLDEVLGECADALAMAAFAKGLDVSLGRDPAIPDALVGDSSLLKHILLNLVDNAVKFTDAGRIRIGAALCEQAVGPGCGPTIEFEVLDTGIGMPRDKLDQAFTRFTQLDASKTRKVGGTGLGLSIVAKSIELMDGSLSVDSEEGVGTRFTFRLAFELGLEEPAIHPIEVSTMRPATLVGFDEIGFADAALALSRIGFDAKRVLGLEEAAAAKLANGGPVIVEEGALPGVDIDDIPGLEGRLVVGTRFGGGLRSRVAPGKAIAFAPLPLRTDGLAAAFEALGLMGRSGEAEAPAKKRKAPVPVPKKDRERKVAIEGASGVSFSELAEALDAAASTGSFAAAERVAKDAKDSLTISGSASGARAAFSALLYARKGDAAGLKEAASRLRAIGEEMTSAARPGEDR
jgi:signal transduction histidine kinase